MSEPLPPDLPPPEAIELLRGMLRIRRLEERAAELYTEGKIRGFLHLYIGEEAIATGLMKHLRPDDAVVSTYREHGHALARGMSMDAIMAEMYGVVEGCSRGRGGSMHLYDADLRFFGGNAIVAGGLPMAVGLALADRMNGRDRVTVCIFGDGAVAEGEFHESMNLAALWNLPVLFCCENNQYAMGTALDRSESEVDLAAKARSYHMEAEAVDGMDVAAVDQASARVIEAIRQDGKPRFIEYRTYRFRAHSMFDAQLYREKAEVEHWRERDPIDTYRERLVEADLLQEDAWDKLETEVRAEVEAAVAFAEAGHLEPVEDLLRDVYTEVAR